MTDNEATRLLGETPEGDVPVGIAVPGFRILRKLGQGGMGVVFEAEQQTPRRRVALKLVRGGAIADEMRIRLFKREADMLARLEHPNIAAIYASGRTPDGHDWFAMELVEGETLGDWMARTGAARPRSPEALRERLDLFRDICDAVSYAHQRGVIHRDLKPSNLVVTAAPRSSASKTTLTEAPRARVKVLDFGLARLTEPDVEGETAASHTGVVRGTLQYMSPEQARGDSDAIDVRTDVYALGVILFELLADRRPYEIPTGILEAVRTISETPPRALAADWPGPGRPDPDLETIVRKALAKEPAERYAGADAVGEDVRRWLASEPILARPPSTMYQLKKLVARKRGPFLAAAAALVLIVAAAITTSILYVRSERNLARAVAAEAQAKDEARTTKETYDFLVGVFDVARPDRARSEQLTAREILENAADRVRGGLTNEPLVRARLMATIGDVLQRLGLASRARPLLEESVKIREDTLGAEAPEVARARNLLALTLGDVGDFPGARAQWEEALRAWTARADTTNLDFVSALSNLGYRLGQLDEDAAGLRTLERAKAILEGLSGDHRDDLARLLGNMATVKMDLHDLPGSGEDLERAAALLRDLGKEETLGFADNAANRGIVKNLQDDPAAALELFQTSLRLREKFLDPDSPEVLQAIGNEAIAHGRLGQYDQGIPLFERLAAAMERVHGPEHPQLARSLYNLGYMRLESGDPAGARAPLERSLALSEKIYGAESMNASMALYSLAEVNRAAGNLRKAREQLERVVAIDEASEGAAHDDVPGDLEALAAVLRQMGDVKAAEAAEARMRALNAAAAVAPEPAAGSTEP